MEPASQDASEGQIKRTSSSSPRSQDGGGLLDRFLGNIAGSLSLKRSSSNAAVGQGTCLICLESVEPEDFEVKHGRLRTARPDIGEAELQRITV